MSELRSDGDAITLDEIGVSLQATFTVSAVDSGSTMNGVSWTFSTDRNNYYVWYNVTDAALGVQDPGRHPAVGIPVSLTTVQAGSAVAIIALTAAQLGKLSEITVSAVAASVVITVKEFGPVADASASAPITIPASTLGVVRHTVATKFLEVERADTGSVVNIIGEDGSSYSVANSAGQDFDLAKINLVGSAALVTPVLGASSLDPDKTDNRPLLGVS